MKFLYFFTNITRHSIISRLNHNHNEKEMYQKWSLQGKKYHFLIKIAECLWMLRNFCWSWLSFWRLCRARTPRFHIKPAGQPLVFFRLSRGKWKSHKIRFCLFLKSFWKLEICKRKFNGLDRFFLIYFILKNNKKKFVFLNFFMQISFQNL